MLLQRDLAARLAPPRRPVAGRLSRAEWLKLSTTRVFWCYVAAAFALVPTSVALSMTGGDEAAVLGSSEGLRGVIAAASSGGLLVLLVWHIDDGRRVPPHHGGDLPDARLPRWSERAPILEELATHRAGLPNAPPGLGRKELAFPLGLRSSDPWADIDARAYREAVRRAAPRRPPGGRFRYSSLGFGLLGDALAARAGAPYEQLLQDRSLSPLGLRDTAISVSSQNRQRLLEGRSRRGHPRPPFRDQIAAAGAIRSSARDLIRFLACSLAPSEGAPGPALGLATQPRAPVGRRMDIGLGWMILRRRGRPDLTGHSGGTWGFRSFAALIPDRQVGVVVLANTARSVDRLGIKLVDLVAGCGPAR